ncbi:MAG: sugar transferase [Patescibacteria group bacterium]
MTIKTRKILMILGDIGIFYASLYLALTIRTQTLVTQGVWADHWPTFTVVFGLWIIGLYIIDFYDLSSAKNDRKFIIRVGVAAAVLTTLAVLYFYTIPNLRIAPKTILIIDVLITLALLIGWRLAFNKQAKNASHSLIAIGIGSSGQSLLQEIQNTPQWGYKTVAIFDENAKPEFSPIPTFTTLDNLSQIISDTDTKTIVVDDKLYTSERYINTLFSIISPDITIIPLTLLYEQIAQKIPVQSISKSWFLENISKHDHDIHDKIQRLVDIVFSLFLLVITLPLYPLIILAIKLDSPGPAFYRQERLGYLGKPFMMIKFRTMVEKAEKNGAQWAQKNDPRITRVGKWMRKSRIDELPQMMNILKGEMSFIGPRAERQAFIEQLEQELPFYKQRLLVKPGASGWAQVNYKYGASVEDALEKLQYDLYYVKNRNWYLDASIVLKTIKIMSSLGGQ